jgi:hypothetical protein
MGGCAISKEFFLQTHIINKEIQTDSNKPQRK